MSVIFKFLALLLYLRSTECYNKLSTKEIAIINKTDENTLEIFQYSGEIPNLFLMWKTVSVNIRFDDSQPPPDDFVLYQNANHSQLLLDYEAGQKFLGFVHKYSLWKSTKIYPFSSTYIGVETKSSYRINVKINVVDYLLLFSFVGGICLFFGARKLSRNMVAFYVGGSSAGILLSFIFIVFILYRLMPKKSLGISMLVGGSSFTLYLLYSVWHNLFTILESYRRYVAVYVVTIGFVSFALCYRLGPPKDIRSQNLIQWSIQIIALILIYSGCQIQAVSAAVICIILLAYNVPKKFLHWIYRLKYRYFPPKQRLLTEEEYIYQGMEETRKALDELREFCRSPKCNTWELTSRLETPKRFASFVSGGSHLSDDELLSHDSDAFGDLPGDDETDDDDGDHSRARFAYVRPDHSKSLLQSNGATSRYSNPNADRRNLNNSVASTSSSRYLERTAALSSTTVHNRSAGYTRLTTPDRRYSVEDDND